MSIPRYLTGHEDRYRTDPLAAATEWFRDAHYGLFLHYGLYSLLGRHEWVQFKEKIRPGDYAGLAHHFTADRFDAGEIADFARACGMKYVNLTTRHHDSFSLFATGQTSFNSVEAAACRRDLVGELAAACDKRGLGFFCYYSHGRDWKHPHAPNNDRWGGNARPAYDPPEPTYATGKSHDLNYYLDFMTRQVEELLTQYGPIAGIWLDGIKTPLEPKDGDGKVIQGFDPRDETSGGGGGDGGGSGGDAFRCQELYDEVHKLQPQCLVSYKQGYLGTEDFFAPEHEVYNRFGEAAADKPGEVCTTTSTGPDGTGRSWGWVGGAGTSTADEVWEVLKRTHGRGYNLLINIGPEPAGSLPDGPAKALEAVGERLKREGFPS